MEKIRKKKENKTLERKDRNVDTVTEAKLLCLFMKILSEKLVISLGEVKVDCRMRLITQQAS